MHDRATATHVTATRWERAMEPGETGGSEPHLFSAGTTSYMVKVSNNPQITGGAGKILVNEVVGGLCLDWLGVNHAKTAIVEVSQSLLDVSPGAKFNDDRQLASGPAFGSEFWPSSPQGTVATDVLDNRSDIAGIVTYDTWLEPHDSRQYRVRKSRTTESKYDCFPVDQGHSIGTNWTPADLQS